MHTTQKQLDNAHDATDRSITDDVADLEDDGADAEFAVVKGGRVHCSGCDQVHAAGQMTLLEVRRQEGKSDPSEMSAVVKLRCQHCGTEGALVVGFGPSASAEDQDVLLALQPVSGRSSERGPQPGL